MKIRDDRGRDLTTNRKLFTWRTSPRIVWTPRQDGELSLWAVIVGIIIYFGVSIPLGAALIMLSESWGGVMAMLAGWGWVVASILVFRRWLVRKARTRRLGRESAPHAGTASGRLQGRRMDAAFARSAEARGGHEEPRGRVCYNLGVIVGTMSLSLAGLNTLAGVAVDPRAAIEWAAGLSYRAVQLDGAAPRVRARELDRSGRRDLAALLRRLQLSLSGLDLWIPPAHFVDPAEADRAVSATVQAIELAADLARLVGSDGAVVSLTLPEKTPGGTVESLSSAAERVGATIADHQWPARPGMGPVGVGIDPAALLAAGTDPAAEVSRLANVPASARLSDTLAGGRVAAGTGKLDVLAYQVALGTKGYGRAVVVDVRGVRDQEGAAKAVLKSAGAGGV